MWSTKQADIVVSLLICQLQRWGVEIVPFDLGDSVLPWDQLHCYVWWKRYIRTRLRHEWWKYSSMGFRGFAKFRLSSLCLTNSMHCFQVDVWSCKTPSKCIRIKELELAWRVRKFFFFKMRFLQQPETDFIIFSS